MTESQRQIVDHRLGRALKARELGSLYNDLFENRQKGDYMDFVSFDGDQVLPWIAQTEGFVAEIAALVAADASSAEVGESP